MPAAAPSSGSARRPAREMIAPGKRTANGIAKFHRGANNSIVAGHQRSPARRSSNHTARTATKYAHVAKRKSVVNALEPRVTGWGAVGTENEKWETKADKRRRSRVRDPCAGASWYGAGASATAVGSALAVVADIGARAHHVPRAWFYRRGRR